MILMFICMCETMRSINLMSLFGLLFLCTTLRMLKMLMRHRYSQNSHWRMYTQLQIIFKIVYPSYKKGNFIIAVALQPLLCLLAWLAIKGWGRVLIALWALFTTTFVLGVFIMTVYMTSSAKINTDSGRLIDSQRTRFYSIRRMGKWNYHILWRIWVAQSKLVVPYGANLEFSRSTPTMYFNLLANNSANMLICFDSSSW
ncbi:unnamed protein product [Orchesella dallaii]|uniref:Uncharacterized protein n=1 Tax=Orchesella dallaii TaxID=48710 RepID=A0ABP1RFX3_9HEXA